MSDQSQSPPLNSPGSPLNITNVERATLPHLDMEQRLGAWAQAPLAELASHILERYHRPLDKALPTLAALAQKAAQAPNAQQSKLKLIFQVYTMLQDELELHCYEEEQSLFPWILSGAYIKTLGPIEAMLQENDTVCSLFAQLRSLIQECQLPVDMCEPWRAFLSGLDELEGSLREHIYLEDRLLFPRVIARARQG